MTTYAGPDGEPTLGDLEKEFGWTCWRSIGGYCYARRPNTPEGDHDARGEDPLDLRDAIRAALAREAEEAYRAGSGGPVGAEARPGQL